MQTCEGDYKVYGTACGKPATKKRKSWWFGDTTKGEPTIVKGFMHFCTPCAAIYDDLQAEGRAEARSS